MTRAFHCPGCGKNASGFLLHEAHYADGDQEWVDEGDPGLLGDVCPYTRDYLSAEWFRTFGFPEWSYP